MNLEGVWGSLPKQNKNKLGMLIATVWGVFWQLRLWILADADGDGDDDLAVTSDNIKPRRLIGRLVGLD